jgi:hypothetical protein
MKRCWHWLWLKWLIKNMCFDLIGNYTLCASLLTLKCSDVGLFGNHSFGFISYTHAIWYVFMDFILYGVLHCMFSLLCLFVKESMLFIELANKSEWWILIHVLLIFVSNFGFACGPVGIVEFTLTCVFYVAPTLLIEGVFQCPTLTQHMWLH